MRLIASLLIALSAALALPAHAQSAEPEVQPSTPPAKRAVRVMPQPGTTVTLERVVTPKAAADRKDGTPTQIGFGRDVGVLSQPGDVRDALHWQAGDDGSAQAALRITSPGAAAMRAGLVVESLPAGALLRFAGNDGEAFEVPAGSIPLHETWWSPVVEGESLVIAIDVPAGSDPAALQLSIPQVSHLYTSASTAFLQPKAASACNLDVSCYASWTPTGNSVARIIFTKGGSSFACTGTLLADNDTSTSIPYFLTANHCIGDPSAASTIQFYWFYRSTACDSGVRGAYQVTTGGGTLLYSTQTTDTSFLRLNATPPGGAVYAGWNASGVTSGASVTGIHHPAGDLQKISFGNVNGYWTCVPGSTGQFNCSGSSSFSSTFLSASWSSGITEGGSSGSALFSGNGRYVVGQLYGGNGSCTTPGSDFYGRLDVAYNNGLSQWLSGTPASGGGGGGGSSGAGGASPAYDVTDLWWNSAESGWGIALTQHGPVVFGAWYEYDSAGRPRWLVMPGGTWTTSTSFTGDLYATTGPYGLGPTFDPTRVVRTKVGVATFNFAASDRGVLSYTVNGVSGSKAITRQPFGSSSSISMGAFADMWWNAGESGWGLSISQQFGSLFAVWYTYGSDGQPVWYVLPGGAWTSNDTYTGTLYRTSAAAAPYFGGAFDPNAVTRTPVGTMSLRFAGPSSGTMTYTVDGVTGTRSITRQSF